MAWISNSLVSRSRRRRSRMSPTIAAPLQRARSGSMGFRSRATTSYRPDSPSRGMRPCPISPFAPVTRTAGLRAIAPMLAEPRRGRLTATRAGGDTPPVDTRRWRGPRRAQGDTMATVTLQVNGAARTVEVSDPETPLLYVLRNDLGLTGTKFGCGLAQCGACTVHVDGQAVRSCVTPVSAVGNGKVVTLAGLGTPEKPHPIQKAYVEEQVPQCGYCINGWIMTAASLLNQTKKPSDAQIKDALTGLKCRCGTHMSILRAVKRASAMMG